MLGVITTVMELVLLVAIVAKMHVDQLVMLAVLGALVVQTLAQLPVVEHARLVALVVPVVEITAQLPVVEHVRLVALAVLAHVDQLVLVTAQAIVEVAAEHVQALVHLTATTNVTVVLAVALAVQIAQAARQTVKLDARLNALHVRAAQQIAIQLARIAARLHAQLHARQLALAHVMASQRKLIKYLDEGVTNVIQSLRYPRYTFLHAIGHH